MTRSATIAAALLAASVVAASAQSSWTPFDYGDSRTPGPNQAENVALWKSKVQGDPFSVYLSKRMQLPDGRTAFVSMVQSLSACQSAANADVSDETAPVCPVVVTISSPRGGSVTATGTACASTPLPGASAQEKAANGTEVSTSGSQVVIRAKVDNAYPPECLAKIDVP